MNIIMNIRRMSYLKSWIICKHNYAFLLLAIFTYDGASKAIPNISNLDSNKNEASARHKLVSGVRIYNKNELKLKYSLMQGYEYTIIPSDKTQLSVGINLSMNSGNNLYSNLSLISYSLYSNIQFDLKFIRPSLQLGIGYFQLFDPDNELNSAITTGFKTGNISYNSRFRPALGVRLEGPKAEMRIFGVWLRPFVSASYHALTHRNIARVTGDKFISFGFCLYK
jgi:hypothetical protein